MRPRDQADLKETMALFLALIPMGYILLRSLFALAN
jgi:hypothetical protein